MALLLLEQGNEHQHADNWATSLGTSVLFLWGLHSKCYGLSLVAAAEIMPCMYSLAVYRVQPLYLPACVPRLPASLPLSSWSIPLCLHNLCNLFFLPLLVAQVSFVPKVSFLFLGIAQEPHVAFPLLNCPASSSAESSSMVGSHHVQAFVCDCDHFTNPVPESYSQKAAWPLASGQTAVPCNRPSCWGHVSCRCLLLPPPNCSFVPANHMLFLAVSDAGVLTCP